MQPISASTLDRLARALVVCVLLISATGTSVTPGVAQAATERQPAPTPPDTPADTSFTTGTPPGTPLSTATTTDTPAAKATASETPTDTPSPTLTATATATATTTLPPTDDLDLTFGGDGVVTTNVDASNDSADYPRAVLVQPDGKIVVAGWYTAVGGNRNYVVVRYESNGDLDPSFGSAGLATTDLGGSLDYAWDAELQPDGRIILAGYTSNGKDTDFAIVRYNSDGSLDSTFGSKGVMTTDLGGRDDFALASVLQADGKIILVGAEWDPLANSGVGARRFALLRYNPNGSLDSSFDGDGKVLGDAWGTNTYLADVAVQPDGKVVAVGAIDNHVTHFHEFAVARYNADGSLDPTFGGDGLVTTDLAEGTWDDAAAVALQPDNKIVVAGAAFGPEGYQFALARYNPDGSLDVTFGGDGKVVESLGGGDNRANALAIQGDGRLFVAGWRDLGDEADSVMARYKPDGALDETFGAGGIVVTEDGDLIPEVSNPPPDYASAMALQPDGKIVVAQEARDIIVARYLGVAVSPTGGVGSPITGAQTAAERQPVPGIRAQRARNPAIGAQLVAERQPVTTLIETPTDTPTDAPLDTPTTEPTVNATDTATLEPAATATSTVVDTSTPTVTPPSVDPHTFKTQLYLPVIIQAAGSTPESQPTPMPTPVPTGTGGEPGSRPRVNPSAQIPADSDCSDGQCAFPIILDTDDAGTLPFSCTDSVASNEIYFGKCDNGSTIASGFRFQNVNVPQGATIAQAYLEFIIDGTYVNPVQATFYGEASANAQTFSDGDMPVNRTTISGVSVSWTVSDDTWIYTNSRRSPDLKAIVQAIVNQGGWQSGNALAIILKGPVSGTAHRRVFAYERPIDCPQPTQPHCGAQLVVKVQGPPVEDESGTGGDPPKGGGGGDPRECPIDACNGSQGQAGDPINTRTGNFNFSWVDLSVPTTAGPLVFQRDYASTVTNTYTTTLGYGWAHNQDTRLIFPGDPGGQAGIVWFKAHSANRFRFDIITGTTTYKPYAGVLASLTYITPTYTLTTTSQSVYTFDSSGRLTQWADPQGHTLSYANDGLGRPITITEPLSGRYLALTYDGQGRITSVKDHAGRHVDYGYSLTTGDLITVTDVLSQTWTHVYSGTTHLLTDVKDPRGVTVVHTEYDAQGRAWKQTNALSQLVTQITYNGNGTSTIMDGRGFTQTHTYDSRGTFVGDAMSLGSTITKTYDYNFRPDGLTDPLNNSTYLLWSANGANLTQMTNELGYSTFLGYDSLNNLTRTVDARGMTTTYAYSGTLMTIVTDTLANTTQYTYTTSADAPQPSNLMKAMTDALGRTTSYRYDALGQRIVMTDALGIVTAYGYDNLGRTAAITTAVGAPQQQVTLNQYDAAGRLTQTTRNSLPGQGQNYLNQYNLITGYQYDSVGNQVFITDTLTRTTFTQYDNLNRPVTATTNYVDGIFNSTRPDEDIQSVTQYDENGNVITTTEYSGITGLERKTYTQYDALNRPVTVTINYQNGVFDSAKPDEDVASTTQYDAAGNVVFTTEAANVSGLARKTFTQYDELNRPITVTANYVDGVFNAARPDEDIATAIEYDANGNASATTQFANVPGLARKTLTGHDELNRLNETKTNYVDDVFDPTKPDEDIITLVQYDAVGNVVNVFQYLGISGLQRRTLTQYDALNRPVTVTTNYVNGVFDPAKPDEDIQTVTQYDANGNVITATMYSGITGLARKTFTQYDSLNRPITVTTNYVDGVFSAAKPDEDIQMVTQYDALGNVISSTQFYNVSNLARVTYSQFDALNRPITVTANYTGTGAFDPNQADRNLIQTTAYNAAGNRLTVTEKRGGPGLGAAVLITTTFGYDALSRLITTTMPLTGTAVASTTVTYDGLGRVVDSLDPLGHKTRTQYDGLDRPITVTVNYVNGVFDITKPDEDLLTVTTYDAAGNRVQVKDPKGVVTKFEYDLLNRLTAVVENYVSGGPTDNQTNVRTEYTYDAAGNRKTIKDGRSKVTTFTYDLLNRMLSTSDPLTHTTQYAYNAVGNVITMTDALTRNTVSTYDLFNRLTKIDYPAPDADVLFTYDGAGQRTVMTDSVGVTTWGYDLVGRPLTITQPFTDSVVYTYDSAGNQLALKYPDGKVVTNTYDLASRPVQVKDWQTKTITYTYDTASRLTSLALPNGITSTYTYDGANRLLALTHQTLTQTVASYTYTLDAVGNRVQVVESGPQATPPPPGNVITVTTTTDEVNTDGDCALREAIRAANLNQAVDACPAGSSSPDTLIVPSGTYTLTRTGSADNNALKGDLDITGTVTLNGAGANLTIITGNTGWNERIFHVLNTTAELSGVTIRNGSSGSNSGAGLRNEGGVVTLSYSAVISNTASGDDGGGLHNTNGGTLTVLYSTVMSNTTGSGYKGGGIFNNAGTLTLTASAVVSNTAGDSGGGVYHNGGTLTVTNSTFSGNRANDDGGGVRSTNSGVATLNNVTLTNNTADADASGVGNGGGVAKGSGTVNVKNTLIAGNFDNSASTKHPDCSGTVNSQGYNLIQSTTGCTITGDTTGNQTGVNPQLGPLANNGGPTLTHALQSGSPAIDKGNPAAPGSGGNACPATDQRGYARPVDGDANGSALCDVGAYEVGATGGAIVYVYDPLYRLIAANYGDGTTFNYTYDAVGNRLTQTTITNTTVYTYDNANRLTNVGAITYTWNANGNLLNDGVYTYTYNTANRLITATQGANVSTFAYNGLGDRQLQVINGITTTYTLDLNAGLTQVLADGTNTYLYGNGRIAQYAGATPAYFLGDALGSVRQLTNSSSAVTLARSYEPFGNTLSSVGSGTTVYQFTGEMRDATGLTYLRARYLSTQVGRFITRDVWPGDYQRPMSFNAWLYAYANPINLTDPSGHDPWWCETHPNPDLCYAYWVFGQTGKVDASLLKAVYEVDPNQALGLLRRQFHIELPPNYQFRFAYTVYGFGLTPREREEIGGINLWFLYEGRFEFFGSAVAEPSEGSEHGVQIGLFLCLSPESLERNAQYIDSNVYILELAFTISNFNPDDVAGVMIHEATHAWQESLALEQVGVEATTIPWLSEHIPGLERQAIDITEDADEEGRIHLSDDGRRRQITNYRRELRAQGPPDSPFILPEGKP